MWTGVRVDVTEQRDGWRRERERRGLVRDEPEFGSVGRMALLDQPRLFVSILPSDPLAQPLGFSDEALTGFVLTQRFSGLTANGVAALSNVTTTADALVRYSDSGSGSPWRAFVGLLRDGGIEVGIGSTVRYELDTSGGRPATTAYRLFVLVHALRAAIESQARLLARLDETGFDTARLHPFEINFALPGAQGAVLGGLADGWEEPQYAFSPSVCLDRDVLVRLELDEWPQARDEQDGLIRAAADRICNAFGTNEPLYLARVGNLAGRLSPDYA